MSPALILLVLIFFLGLGGIGLMLAGAGGRRLSARARRLGARRRQHAAPTALQLRRGAPKGIDVFAARVLPRPEAIRQRLAASGLQLTLGGYLAVSGGTALAALILALVEKTPVALALLVALFAGLVLPHLFINSRIGARQKRFFKLFPDAIGLMVRGLKAGLPVSECIILVGRETPNPVGEEFRRVADQVRLGQSLDDALWGVARRISLPEFNFLVITMAIQRETGGNLAETLQNLDNMVRMREQMKLKVKAMSSEAMATATIIGSLPFAMSALLFVVAHKYIMTLITTELGHVLLLGGFVWLSIGVFIMSQMVRFEI
ncbi:MAG: type II secretion system F family protein [Alphaproteobacteria bacterium]|jgi:tight adherence protein B|nr:type II secretion system F family protein [Alphaproteobacteria bacterium]